VKAKNAEQLSFDFSSPRKWVFIQIALKSFSHVSIFAKNWSSKNISFGKPRTK
jgi:hypothetical protein